MITNDFFSNSRIPDNKDTRGMMDFLTKPENVFKMKVASDMGLPAISPVVHELEEQFGNCALAPLNHDGTNQNALHRQNVGRMIKFIMGEIGYAPIDGRLSERARIPKFARSSYFSTSAVYGKCEDLTEKYRIEVILK